MQLLATTKHQNLTVPKGDAGKGEDLEELARLNPNDPLVCLHRGIDAHERGDLEESAQLFEQSANGGCGLGMLMFGLALRHGWVSLLMTPQRGQRVTELLFLGMRISARKRIQVPAAGCRVGGAEP